LIAARAPLPRLRENYKFQNGRGLEQVQEEADVNTLLDWSERVLTADSIEEVLK
jgi:hypothetical protein